jgi:DNA-binding response OmpR family regulator
MATVLVVEDDPAVRAALVRHLTAAGHAVRSAGAALDAMREVTQVGCDLVVLDLGLPDLDGAAALRMLRGVTDVPVVVATARDDDASIVRLLNSGADDYLVKPFTPQHLNARIAAVLRRTRPGGPGGGDATGPIASPPLRVGDLAVDVRRRTATLAGASLDLTRREFDLLAYLAARPGEVVARGELLSTVWQQAYGGDQTIDVHLSWLRRKLGETAARPRYLHTVRGVGVKLEAPGSQRAGSERPSSEGRPAEQPPAQRPLSGAPRPQAPEA